MTPISDPKRAAARVAWRVLLLSCGAAASCAPVEETPRPGMALVGDPATAQEPPPGLEYVPPEPGTYVLHPIQAAADGVVVDADGARRRLFDYMGDKNVLLSFIYLNCTDSEGCPLATAVLRMVKVALEEEPDLAKETRLITLSFDPARDTPDVMRMHAGPRYLETQWDERPWSFVTTGSEEELQPILDGYGQYIIREVDEAGNLTGDFSHVLKVYLIDRQRRVRNIYSTSFLHPAIAINDLKTILMEEPEGG